MPRRRSVPPRRGSFSEDARESLCLLRREDQTVNVVLVALTDAVELEVWADGTLRRRLRFLRDTEARKYGERLSNRLRRRRFTNVRLQ
jgi:hypothetical protein